MSEEKRTLADRVARVKALQDAMKQGVPPPAEKEEEETEEEAE